MANRSDISRHTISQVKQCCATLYQSDLARYLLGDSFHPGGLQTTRRLGNLLGLSSASHVLDAACGNGTTAVFLAKEFGCEVVGVDYGDQNIATARVLAEAENVGGRVRFERSDAEMLAFGNGSFDAIICECAFCTFPQKNMAASEFFRVLRSGGRLGMSDVTREEILPESLSGLLAWIACIGDAQTGEGYIACFHNSGFSVDHIELSNEALLEMVDEIRMKLLGAEVLRGLGKLQLPGVDLAAAKGLANSVMTAIRQGQLGYVLICATKPHQ
jgi:ubiquinone/menaquinone biosynthesis C-methylase UbiE